MTDSHIFIYCDRGAHAPRRVPVGSFRRFPASILTPSGGWHELPSQPRSVRTGYTLHGNDVDSPGWALEDQDGVARVNVDLICNRCKDPWTLSEGKLHAALDAVSGIGVLEVSLSELAAIVQKQAEG